jgi:Tfp pilus assembly protein PilZ
MEFGVASASQTKAVGLRPVGRRGHYRHQIQTLAYVNLDQANGGVIRNLGDAGMAIQAVTPLYVTQQVVLRFDLPNPRVRLEAKGRVAWADPVGQAGIEFLALSQRSRRLLKEWIFVQLIASAEHVAGDSTYLYGKGGQEAAELTFSSYARPGIRLRTGVSAPSIVEREIEYGLRRCILGGYLSQFPRTRFHGWWMD